MEIIKFISKKTNNEEANALNYIICLLSVGIVKVSLLPSNVKEVGATRLSSHISLAKRVSMVNIYKTITHQDAVLID